jgi:hypothetical protein
MPVLIWDSIGGKVFESGLDRGVLYLPDGSAVPWNGLTSVDEHVNASVETIYYDGQKISELVSLGEFSASMKALTYPDEFVELEGVLDLKNGLFANQQQPRRFSLCYRTRVGNDLNLEAGYKIHLIYNVLAIPSDKSYSSLGSDVRPVEFEWTITAIPENVPGLRPTSHITIDSQKTDPLLLAEIEAMLYGSTHSNAALIPMDEFVAYITEWYRIKIIDHHDGTWSAVTRLDSDIEIEPDLYFEIFHCNARFIDEDTFIISDAMDIEDIPELLITDDGNGAWSASTSEEGLISIEPDGFFQITDANAVFITPDEYEISNTAFIE